MAALVSSASLPKFFPESSFTSRRGTNIDFRDSRYVFFRVPFVIQCVSVTRRCLSLSTRFSLSANRYTVLDLSAIADLFIGIEFCRMYTCSVRSTVFFLDDYEYCESFVFPMIFLYEFRIYENDYQRNDKAGGKR